MVHALQQLAKQDVVDYYCKHIAPGSKQRCKLCVVSESQHAKQQQQLQKQADTTANGHHHNTVEVQDIDKMKEQLHMAQPTAQMRVNNTLRAKQAT